MVVFIDDLDRCRPKDVIEILSGLRTFFDVQSCVFVVAVGDTPSSHTRRQGRRRYDGRYCGREP